MKFKKISIIALSILGVVTLTACANFLSQEKAEKSPFDEEALSVAIKTNDTKYCEKIIAEKMRKDCEQKINDKKIYEKALIEKDENACNQIKTDQLRYLCAQQLKDEKDEMKKQRIQKEKEQKEIEKEAEIEKSGNIKDCESLEQEHLKTQCKLNIATTWASEKKDPKYCAEVEESLRKICEEAAQ